MTVVDVIASVAEIEAIKMDDEAAHGKEDSLREDVLRAIADGHPDARGLAVEALKTSEINFSRWCA